MLTTRNVILAIAMIAVLSIGAALVSFFGKGPTQSTLGRDSYGTRTEGYRAVYELLNALDFDTQRSLIPTTPEETLAASYVLWNPQDRIVQTEPAYLNLLSQWVQAGGYLLIAPAVPTDDSDDTNCQQCSAKSCSTCVPLSVLSELGLGQVSIEQVIPTTKEKQRRTGNSDRQDDAESLHEAVRDVFRVKKRPTAAYPITWEGAWDYLRPQATHVVLPSDEAWEIRTEGLEPLAKITIDYAEQGVPSTLAALFPLGKGRVAVISNPFLASNANLIAADNSVLLAHLMTDSRPQVIFDEFYHGLTVRGNALWLLSKPPYAIITVSLLAVVGIGVWRQAIFLGPSRQEKPVSRRDIGEYLEAMSRFLLRGKGSAKYVLSEVRQGVLWHYCKTLGLPPQQQNTDVVLGLLSRRLPQQASQLQEALQHADGVLKNPRATQDEILLATRKVSDCLST